MNDKYLHRTIQLAQKALGNTYPNPLVGAVIVHEDKIIGEAWHHQAGMPHAEVLAIAAVKDKKLLKEATLYVSLEPCAHYGKTPPCTDLIITYQIPRIVIGIQDSYSKVDGLGIKKLRDAGCEVILSEITQDFWQLNKRFFTFHEQKRPYIILKWAQSVDAYIDADRTLNNTHTPQIITHSLAQQLNHKWRTEEQAILVGKNTILQDNPKLNARLWKGNNPLRVILDSNLEITTDFQIFNDESPSLILNLKKDEKLGTIIYKKIANNDVKTIINTLYELNVQSILVEGGTKVLQSFIDATIWDEVRLFIAPIALGNGIKAPQLKDAKLIEKQTIGIDDLYLFKNNNNCRNDF